jgi:hypothetical protein
MLSGHRGTVAAHSRSMDHSPDDAGTCDLTWGRWLTCGRRIEKDSRVI